MLLTLITRKKGKNQAFHIRAVVIASCRNQRKNKASLLLLPTYESYVGCIQQRNNMLYTTISRIFKSLSVCTMCSTGIHKIMYSMSCMFEIVILKF